MAHPFVGEEGVVRGAELPLGLKLDVLLAQLVHPDDLDAAVAPLRRQLVLVLALRVLGEQAHVALAQRARRVRQRQDCRLVLLARQVLVAPLGHLRTSVGMQCVSA